MTPEYAIQKMIREMPNRILTYKQKKLYLKMAFGIGYDYGNRANRNHLKQIAKVDEFGKIIEIYDSATSAARKNDTRPTHITAVCKGRRHMHKKCMYKYLDKAG
jgi:hypothetical protein